MANYLGETFEITNLATDFDATALTPSKVTGVTVEIVNAAASPVVVVANHAMTWDATRALWFYLWDTSLNNVTIGSYTAKVTVVGLDGTKSFSYLKLSLKAVLF